MCYEHPFVLGRVVSGNVLMWECLSMGVWECGV